MFRHSAVPFAALLLVAACGPKSETPAVAAVDTAAVRAGADSLRSAYSRLQIAGDAKGVAMLHTEDAGVDLYGAPRMRGRAQIEAGLTQTYAARKFSATDITPLPSSFNAQTSTDGSELGTYHDMWTEAGKTNHEWGRYLVAFHKDSDGQWRLVYLMAFADSTKVDK